MIRTAIKGVFAHKLRLAMTALAIVMGVAFVSGTYVFTDTINARFDSLFTDVYSGIDATVRPVDAEFGDGETSFDASVLDAVTATEGVATAAPAVGGVAQIISPAGDPIGGQGPPTIGTSWTDVPALNPLRILEGNGRAPAAPGEVAIDVATAEREALAVGDVVGIQVRSGVEPFEIVGLASFGSEDNLAGATLAAFEFGEAQRLFDLEGRYSQIDVLAADGITPEVLAERLAAAVPQGLEAVTGAEQTQEQLDAFSEGLGFVETALLAFAAVAVFVGAFIIQNTFRIIVAQRTKELAMLRAVGATGRQVVATVIIEALVVAVVASAIGVIAGVGFASLLKVAMDAAGFGMPDGPLTVEPRTIVIGMAVGIVVTLTSALLPARKASRVAPIAAMRDVAPTSRSLHSRSVAGGITLAAGVAALAAGLVLENGSSLLLVGLGSLVIFVGVSVLAPLVARRVASVLGRPFPGIAGRLARENTKRQPRRTAATASALMVGVALVAFVSIFGASVKASISDTLETAFPADLAFQSTNFNTGVSPQVTDRLAGLDEVEVVSPFFTGKARIDGTVVDVFAVDPDTVERVYAPEASIPMVELGDGILVHEDVAKDRGWSAGDVVAVEYAFGGSGSIQVAGTYADQTFGNYLISDDTYAANFTNDEAFVVFATFADGVDLATGRTAAEAVLTDFPAIDMNTASEQAEEAAAVVDQMLALFSALLGLAIVIAVIGIANTLALSIVERTREIGLLRAVGMGRRGIRRMVRFEAVITAVFGAVLGVAIGAGLGWAVVASLADEGLGTLTFPVGQLALWLVLAGVAGVVAAIGPARKASRLNILEAIAYE